MSTRTNGAIAGGAMAIYRLLEKGAYDPRKVRVMIDAYECACRELNLAGNKTDRITEIVAKRSSN
jgi:hypothetical protein